MALRAAFVRRRLLRAPLSVRGLQLDALNQELAEVFGTALQPLAADGRGATAVAPPERVPEHVPASLTHVDVDGRLGMVDVGSKSPTLRTAAASARVLLGRDAFTQVAENRVKKGDVLVVAQLAGINAAKLTSQLIPLCHSLNLSWVKVQLTLERERNAVHIRTEAQTVGPTGVEMEALTAAAVAGLTVYDMVKAVTKDARLTDIQLEAKSGGRSGTYTRRGDAV